MYASCIQILSSTGLGCLYRSRSIQGIFEHTKEQIVLTKVCNHFMYISRLYTITLDRVEATTVERLWLGLSWGKGMNALNVLQDRMMPNGIYICRCRE
jgi:hypothetical protein